MRGIASLRYYLPRALDVVMALKATEIRDSFLMNKKSFGRRERKVMNVFLNNKDNEAVQLKLVAVYEEHEISRRGEDIEGWDDETG